MSVNLSISICSYLSQSVHMYLFHSKSFFISIYPSIYLLWPRKGSQMKTQTQILDNGLYYTRKIELHRKGKKSRTVRITPILICPSGSEISQYFPKSICLKVNVIARLEFELAYYDSAVHRFNHYTTKTPPIDRQIGLGFA